MPPENLVQPEAVRRLAWTPPREVTAETVADALRASGARAWQVTRVAAPLAQALPEPARPDPEPQPEPERTAEPVEVEVAVAPAEAVKPEPARRRRAARPAGNPANTPPPFSG
jgi:hypothetical protein